MSQPPVESLFHARVLDVPRMRWFHWLLLIAWTPIGLPIMCARAVLMILASAVVPPTYRAWWLTTLGGVYLRARDRIKIKDHGVVVVANHMSYLDGVTVAAAVRSRVPLAITVWHKVNWLNRFMARPCIEVYASGRNRRLIDDVRAYLQHGNVLLFPEGTVSDGYGVLKFERMAFSLDRPVAVVALRYKRAFRFMRPTTLRDKLLVQAFFDLFQPWVIAEAYCLGMHHRAEGEDPADFAVRVQRMIAEKLNVPATNYTWRDRRKLMQARSGKAPPT